MGQGHLRVIIHINYEELEHILIHAKFHDHMTISSVGEDFEGFYYILAWRPSRSCVVEDLYKLSFPLPKGAPH